MITVIRPSQGPVQSFELKGPDDTIYTISIDAELDYGFDLAHLHEHLDEELPVKVGLEERNGTLFATSVDDV